MNEVELGGALADPCPVCGLKSNTGVNTTTDAETPCDGAIIICFGCTLVSIIRDGMPCALTEDDIVRVYSAPEFIGNLLRFSAMRAHQPWRTAEIIREQRVAEWERNHPDKPCPDCGKTIKGLAYGQRESWPLCPCGYPHK